jgi:tetratricopeptide (TPR) repeat protein
MKKSLLICLLILFIQQAKAQTEVATVEAVETVDSVKIEEIETTKSLKESQGEKLYSKAYDFYKKKNYSKALEFIDKAIIANHQNIDYYNLKAYLYSYLKDYENAVKTADAALKINPEESEFYEIKANGLNFLNKKDQAIEAYSKMLELEKHNARYYNNYMTVLKDLQMFDKLKEVYQTYLEAMKDVNKEMKHNERFGADIHFYASLAYNNSGDIAKSLELLNKSIELSPNYAGYYSNRGTLFSDKKNYTDALIDYNKAISLDSKNGLYYFNRGSVYLDLKKDNEALSDFQLAQKHGYNEDGLYQNLGNVYKNLKRNDEALIAYQKALEINPNNKELHNNLAVLYKQMGKKTESDTAYNQAVATGVKTHIPFYNQGFDAMKRKEFEKAIPLFKKAINEKPDFVEGYNQLGICYNELEKDSLALETYTAGIEKDKNYVILYHNRANIYKKMGNFEAAKGDYLTALKLNPTMNTEYYSLAVMYMQQNNNKLAQQYFDLATQSGVSIEEYFIDYSAFLSKTKQHLKGEEILLKGIKQYPKNYDLLINLASNYSDQNEEEKNAQILKKAILLNPKKADAYYNLGNYYLLSKKDLTNAEKNYQLAIAKNGAIMEAYLNLASVYDNMGNEAKMMQTMDNLIVKFPNAYEAYYNRAEFLYGKGMTQEAIADFEKSFELMDAKVSNEKNGTYTINIEKSSKSLLKAQAYQMMGQFDKAIPGFQSYLTFNTQDANAYNNYAYCLLESGKPDEALTNFEKAYQLNQQEIDVLLGLIVSNYLLRNKTNLKKYKKVLENDFPAYKANQQLPEILTKEGYFYTPKFIKIWNDAIQK